jgi:hypothetical protein
VGATASATAVGRQRGERLDRDDVAGHDESDELGSDEVDAEGHVVRAQDLSHGAQDFAGDELAQPARDLGFAGGGMPGGGLA